MPISHFFAGVRFCRASEDLTVSPKMQLDTSLTLSSSSSSLQTSPRSHSVLIPGLPDKLTPKAPVPVRLQMLLPSFSWAKEPLYGPVQAEMVQPGEQKAQRSGVAFQCLKEIKVTFYMGRQGVGYGRMILN